MVTNLSNDNVSLQTKIKLLEGEIKSKKWKYKPEGWHQDPTQSSWKATQIWE